MNEILSPQEFELTYLTNLILIPYFLWEYTTTNIDGAINLN